MSVRFRSGMVLAASSVAWAWVSAGCNRDERNTRQLLAEASEAFDRLHPKLAGLRAGLDSLRHEVEDLAGNVPGGTELRSRYFGADEVLGVLDAKIKWLAGELEAAKRGPSKQQASSLRDAIVRTAGDLRQVDDVTVELQHEKARLQRIAALFAAPYEHELPTGYLIKGAKDGVESQLIGFMEAGDQRPDQRSWFDCDRLELAGTAVELAFPESRSQLENVAQILGAYPAAKLRIGVRADRPGVAAAKLAAARAQAVAKALVQSGVDAARLEAGPLPSQRSACFAKESEDCHARIAVLVTAK